MEAQSHTEVSQTISHEHANGEVFAANDLEAARGMCPVLGKMTLEEAGLLLELEAIGKEQIANQQEKPQEKHLIEKVENIQPKDHEIKKVTAPVTEEHMGETVFIAETSDRPIEQQVVEESENGVVAKPLEVDMRYLLEDAEAISIVNDTKNLEEISTHNIEEPASPEIVLQTARIEKAYHQTRIEHADTARFHGMHQKAERQLPASNELARQRVVTPTEQPNNTFITAEREVEEAELIPIIESVEYPKVNEGAIEPAFFEADEEPERAIMNEFNETETLDATETEIDNDLFKPDETISIIDAIERSSSEYTDDAAALPEIVEAALSVEDERPELIKFEASSPAAIPELPAPVAQIEVTMGQLVELIENSDTDESGRVEVMLEEIIALPTKFEQAAADDVQVLEEKLEVYFVELFEEANIKYTPELIKSFAKLTRAHYLEELLKITREDNVEQGLPYEIGTREFLQKLQHGFRSMKQAAINFYEIGKTILRLYTLEPQRTHITV